MQQRRATMPTAIAIGCALIAMTAACAAQQRYSFLSYVFDGVPAPPGVAPRPAPGRQPLAVVPAANLIPRANPANLKKQPAPIVSIHAPVREHKCRECHGTSSRVDLLPTDARLCDKCHLQKRVSEGWNHGPINLGTCIPCHVAHESQYPHLLEKPIPDLCMDCHSDMLQRKIPQHDVPNIDDCTKCHNPHKLML